MGIEPVDFVILARVLPLNNLVICLNCTTFEWWMFSTQDKWICWFSGIDIRHFNSRSNLGKKTNVLVNLIQRYCTNGSILLWDQERRNEWIYLIIGIELAIFPLLVWFVYFSFTISVIFARFGIFFITTPYSFMYNFQYIRDSVDLSCYFTWSFLTFRTGYIFVD